MNELAGQVSDRRDYASALKMYTQSCAVATGIQDRAGLAACTPNSGVCHSRLYHFEEALALYAQADALYQSLGDHAGVTDVLNSGGILLLRGGSDKEALATYQRAMTEAALSGDQVLVAHTNMNTGNLYKETGKYRLAIECFQKALAITQSQNAADSRRPGAPQESGGVGDRAAAATAPNEISAVASGDAVASCADGFVDKEARETNLGRRFSPQRGHSTPSSAGRPQEALSKGHRAGKVFG
jgi:tetratricopeptide (TPR) repeat protein